MQEMNVLIEYFKCLTEYNVENNLSDFIYYGCCSSYEFKKLFISFIFKDIDYSLISASNDIEREYRSKDNKCRVDFKISINDQDFLIENKINDLDDHYEKYTKSFPDAKIGFIANYDVTNIKYYYKTTWKSFYSFLIEKCKTENIALFKCLAEYIKGVCNFMEERNFNPTKTADLNYIVKIIEDIIMHDRKNNPQLNNKARGCSENRIGKYFSIENNKKKTEYWFGLYVNDDSNNFWIEKLNSYKNIYKDGKTYKKDESDENNSCWFQLNSNIFEELIDERNQYTQKYEKLKKFYDEVTSLK